MRDGRAEAASLIAATLLWAAGGHVWPIFPPLTEPWPDLEPWLAITVWALCAWAPARRTLARFPSGIDTDSLRLLLTAAALAGGWGWTQAPAAVLMGWAGVLSRWALQRPIRASRRQLEKMPEDVAVIGCDGLEQVAPLDAVVRGLRLRVPAGNVMPVDGIVRSGRAVVDEAPAAGQAAPVEKEPGDAAAAGSMVLEGEVIVEASAAPAESRIAQGTRLLRAAVGSSSPQELRRARLAMRIGAAVLYLAAGLACIWVFALGSGVSSATQRAMTLALLGAPTAWLLADRLVLGESLWNAFRRGVLIRDAAALADFAQVRIAAFDEAAVSLDLRRDEEAARLARRLRALGVRGALLSRRARPGLASIGPGGLEVFAAEDAEAVQEAGDLLIVEAEPAEEIEDPPRRGPLRIILAQRLPDGAGPLPDRPAVVLDGEPRLIPWVIHLARQAEWKRRLALGAVAAFKGLGVWMALSGRLGPQEAAGLELAAALAAVCVSRMRPV